MHLLIQTLRFLRKHAAQFIIIARNKQNENRNKKKIFAAGQRKNTLCEKCGSLCRRILNNQFPNIIEKFAVTVEKLKNLNANECQR